MITNGLKYPNKLYLEAKNQNMSRYGHYYYFVFWLILTDDNPGLISLITKKTYIEQL